MASEPRDLMYRREAADYIHMPPATLAQWAYRGIGPGYMKVGRRVLYRKSELDAWLESRRVTTSEAS
jgi:excisionase family DNA binding protein